MFAFALRNEIFIHSHLFLSFLVDVVALQTKYLPRANWDWPHQSCRPHNSHLTLQGAPLQDAPAGKTAPHGSSERPMQIRGEINPSLETTTASEPCKTWQIDPSLETTTAPEPCKTWQIDPSLKTPLPILKDELDFESESEAELEWEPGSDIDSGYGSLEDDRVDFYDDLLEQFRTKGPVLSNHGDNTKKMIQEQEQKWIQWELPRPRAHVGNGEH
ncbi:hypothetical protein J3R30DRAFT_3413928 [Lentinula aciculospora]|uniref:Uncharacterized protein n=1 Tax=Lentinula aciculospora TaxID=153920 RepID=A0A9W8ZSH4_9AGAR|nr:hypothetical protein J3R30DRAFT_3413928 [Lentinula aciculospora]